MTSLPQAGAFSDVRLAGRSTSLIEGWASVEISAFVAAFAFALVTGQSLGFWGIGGAIQSDRRASRNRSNGRTQLKNVLSSEPFSPSNPRCISTTRSRKVVGARFLLLRKTA